jgi:hypothetical protein
VSDFILRQERLREDVATTLAETPDEPVGAAR